jgi:hypothetical protein
VIERRCPLHEVVDAEPVGKRRRVGQPASRTGTAWGTSSW